MKKVRGVKNGPDSVYHQSFLLTFLSFFLEDFCFFCCIRTSLAFFLLVQQTISSGENSTLGSNFVSITYSSKFWPFTPTTKCDLHYARKSSREIYPWTKYISWLTNIEENFLTALPASFASLDQSPWGGRIPQHLQEYLESSRSHHQYLPCNNTILV